MKPTKTWIMIADGARARILENEGPGRGLKEVPNMTFAGDHSATHNIVDDRQGRSYKSNSPARSAVEPRSDPHRALKSSFAHHLADVLAEELAKKSYDRLVIVAAPVTLGDLRSAISDHVRAKVVGEIASDLTKTPNIEIGSHLKDVLIT